MPILLYHRILKDEFDTHKYAIDNKTFEKQIKYLTDNEYKTILVNDLCHESKCVNLKKKTIAITFDDGNLSDYSIALPILKEYGHVATFFITVNWIGREQYLEWFQVKELSEAGMSVQSHSLSHSYLSDIEHKKKYKEITVSKQIIEKKLKNKVEVFSLPGGFFSSTVLNILKKEQYAGLCTSVPGMNMVKDKQRDIEILNRFVITRKTSFSNYKAFVHGDLNVITLCKAKHYLKVVAKKLLGTKNYYFIWSRLLRNI